MIPLPLQPKIIEKKGNKAIFEIEALYPGYGVTIGNSLRRVLLSSLSGAAITQVKIKGVSHEFSTIPGVLEDVITLLLNLKQLRFKMYSEDPQKAILKVKGEKEVKGSDFELPSQLELVNKNNHIATLTEKKSELEMEVVVEKGLGYETADKRKKEKLPVGVIAIDSIFTPIKNVVFRVENMRVGERTDFDKLYLEIETDGTITPELALSQASNILTKHFSLIGESLKGAQEEHILKEGDILKTKIEDLKLSNRTIHALQKNGIQTLAGIIGKNEKSLAELEGMGEKAIKEIKKALKKLGMELKTE